MNVTEEMLIAFVTGAADEDTRQRIETQLKVPGSSVQQWFAEMQRWARNAHTVDWCDLARGEAVVLDDAGDRATKDFSEGKSLDGIERIADEHASSRGVTGERRAIAFRKARERVGLAIGEVVERVNGLSPGLMSEAQLQAIESGRQRLPITLAGPIANALGVNVSELLIYDEVPSVSLLRTGVATIEEKGNGASGRKSVVLDVERELRDFVNDGTAGEMVTAWQQGRPKLERWLADFDRDSHDVYQNALVQALARISLLKSHDAAAAWVDALVELAGNDPRRQVDAFYLQGRQRWYSRRIGEAVTVLSAAYELSTNRCDLLRRTQCLHYLARVGIDYPDQFGRPARECIMEGLEIAEQIGRHELVLLFKRADAMRLHKEKDFAGEKRLLLLLLGEADESDDLDPEHIMGSLWVNLAIALRRDFTEASRQKAEEIYKKQIAHPRSDSHAGMCHYLLADLYIDRMIDALHRAAPRTMATDAAERISREAKQHRELSLQLCETARQMLSSAGDLAALHKASRRLVFLRNVNLGLPLNSQTAVDEFALREHRINCAFLGAPALSVSGAYKPESNRFTREELEQLLEELALGAYRRIASVAQHASLANLLRPSSALCIPLSVGDSLVVRLFRVTDDGAGIANFGWFAVRNYASQLRPMLAEFLAMDDAHLVVSQSEVFEAIQTQVETIEPVGLGPGENRVAVDDLVILAPGSNIDWACPMEWLSTEPAKTGGEAMRLVDLPSRSMVFASPDSSPFVGLRARIAVKRVQVFASTQLVGKRRLCDTARTSLGDVTPFDVGMGGPSVTIESSCVIVLAHADEEGVLQATLDSWDFKATQSLFLLFCSSGHYESVRGPFLESLIIRLRGRLSQGSAITAARIPVDVQEAIRFASEIKKWSTVGAEVAGGVLGYIRSRSNPFSAPWVIFG